MNPVLLTGATGFIGQNLLKALHNQGIPVRAVIRPASAHKSTLPEDSDILLAELSDHAALAAAVEKSRAVIYCAGSVRGRSLEDFDAANVSGVRCLVDAMNTASVKAPLLLISSLAASRPQVSDYANSKFLGEQEVINRADFPWSIFRPPAVYGPGDKEMLPVLKLARKGLIAPAGPPDQRLSLIHVEDLTGAILAWLGSWEKCSTRVFTLDDGHADGYDWQQIANAARGDHYHRLNIPGWLLTGLGHLNLAISRMLGYSPMLTPGKARELTQADWLCNNKDLSTATGWSPRITLKAGIQSLFGEDKNPDGKTTGRLS